ncbi:MAG: hypothetical protein ACE5RG_02215 [Candidatus Nitrosomaritimum yanchengensis]
MATTKQIQASQQNIKKAQKTWQKMSKKQRSSKQPEGASRKKPGMGNDGNYYRVVIRPKSEFVKFRTHDVGREGHTKRIAGKRSSGSWATHSWLINKNDAIVENDQLKTNDAKTKKILDQLRGPIKKYKGNIFRAKPRKNIPEKDKPTKKQREAREKNIKKAQKVRAKIKKPSSKI